MSAHDAVVVAAPDQSSEPGRGLVRARASGGSLPGEPAPRRSWRTPRAGLASMARRRSRRSRRSSSQRERRRGRSSVQCGYRVRRLRVSLYLVAAASQPRTQLGGPSLGRVSELAVANEHDPDHRAEPTEGASARVWSRRWMTLDGNVVPALVGWARRAFDAVRTTGAGHAWRDWQSGACRHRPVGLASVRRPAPMAPAARTGTIGHRGSQSAAGLTSCGWWRSHRRRRDPWPKPWPLLRRWRTSAPSRAACRSRRAARTRRCRSTAHARRSAA